MANESERVVLITGAGGGLGAALVTEFSSHGWRVVAAARGGSAEEKGSVWRESLDVTRREQAQLLVDRILKRWNRIDVLINNAGTLADASLAQTEDADWEKVLSVNLKGAFLCAQ